MRASPMTVLMLAAVAQGAGPMPMEPLAAGSYAARAVDGARIAGTWCYSCHMVTTGQGKDAAPTFATIAINRSPAEIRTFLARPHGGMPPIQLSSSQIDDIIAYMKSLNP